MTLRARLMARGIPVLDDNSCLDVVSRDFGGIARGRSGGVIRVARRADVCCALELAQQGGVQLTPRTSGNSQSGQSLSDGGFTLDLSGLCYVSEPDSNALLVSCEGGASWRSLLARVLPLGLIPRVTPLNLNLSVAGTLSAGGIGVSSHRFGSCAACVEDLVVVTGEGAALRCSRSENAELFALVLGGQGRCGVVVEATLRLRKTTGHVQTYYLLYEALDVCLADLALISAMSDAAYAEAYCSSLLQGLRVSDSGRRPLFRWFFGLQISREVQKGTSIDLSWLGELKHREIVHVEDDSLEGFASRYDVRFENMRNSGDWDRPHPWFECFLPPSRADEFILDALERLPPAFGDGHRIFEVRIDESLKYFSMPPAERGAAIAFAVLPTSVPVNALGRALPVLRDLDEALARVGGKRYLSGWIDAPTKAFWQTHFGERYEPWVGGKRRYDPRGVLSSKLFSELDREIYVRGS